MVNILDFTNRLKKILNYHQLTASLFADKIGVQRSSISHILSGRNKPSLDFVMKVLSYFPEVDLYWLLNGKGVFPREIDVTAKKNDLTKQETMHLDSLSTKSSDIDRIVVFFQNGTYKNYKN